AAASGACRYRIAPVFSSRPAPMCWIPAVFNRRSGIRVADSRCFWLSVQLASAGFPLFLAVVELASAGLVLSSAAVQLPMAGVPLFQQQSGSRGWRPAVSAGLIAAKWLSLGRASFRVPLERYA